MRHSCSLPVRKKDALGELYSIVFQHFQYVNVLWCRVCILSFFHLIIQIMLEKASGSSSFWNNPKTKKIGERYVYLRITVDGVSKELSTKRLWKSSRWNPAAGKAEGSHQDSKNLNAYLETRYFKALQSKTLFARKCVKEKDDSWNFSGSQWSGESLGGQRIYCYYTSTLLHHDGSYAILYPMEIWKRKYGHLAFGLWLYFFFLLLAKDGEKL